MKLNVLGIVLCLLALMGCSEVSKGVNIESEDNAPEYELNKLASLSNGKVFDGKKGLLKAFTEVRSYN